MAVGESIAFNNRLQREWVCAIHGTMGDAYDNAMAGSFFVSLECELFARRNWKNKIDARLAASTWIESR